MMTAIIVAAIPFPDAAATDTTSQSQTGDGQGSGSGTMNPLTTYTYTSDDEGGERKNSPTTTTGGVDLSKPGPDATSGTEEALITRVTTSGQYMIYKQFDYATDTFNGVTAAYITDYNDADFTDKVELTESIYMNYEKVLVSDFDDWFTDNPTVTLKTSEKNDLEELKTFFSGNSEYQAYVNDQSDPKQDKTISITLADYLKTTEQKETYYCFKKYYDYYVNNYRLKLVIDQTGTSTSAQNNFNYLFQGPMGTTISGKAQDLNGFLVGGTAFIRAIGNGAFKGVKNVRYMSIPSEINYIGDSAFEASFLEELDIKGAKNLGNYAFKSCTQLKKVTMGDGLDLIGTEAFEGCTQLQEIVLPDSLATIGKGAFANCENLSTVNLDPVKPQIGAGVIKEGAFYNCNLGNLNFGTTSMATIENGAFATNLPGTDGLINVDMSQSGIKELGDHIFAGRTQLKKVVMPGQYGATSEVTLKTNTFARCIKLERVEFPEQCGLVKYESSDIFKDIQNEEFSVKGPEKDMFDQPATERVATRNTINALKKGVPYVYVKDGVKYYEVQQYGFLFNLIPNQGAMTASVSQCDFVGDPGAGVTLSIPANVGPYKVIKLEENCFTENVRKYSSAIEVPHGSIEEIGPSVFKDFDNIEEVFLGDSVKTIGNAAFQDCDLLKKATIGKNITSIGADAFRGCKQLTDVIFEHPDSMSSLPLSAIGENAFLIDENESAGAKLVFQGAISPEYGPYAYAMNPDTFVNKKMGIRVCYKSGDPEGFTIILDNQNNYPTLVDYRIYDDLSSITAKDKEGNEITLKDKYENGEEADNFTAMETYIIESMHIIRIPAGIKSIDVKGFISDSSPKTEDAVHSNLSNTINVAAYLEPGAHPSTSLSSNKFDNYKEYGLFNGNLADGTEETDNKNSFGNDRIKFVVMEEVKYLPNSKTGDAADPLAEIGIAGGAFYSCENLEGINFGGTIEDLGSLPVLSCHNLDEVLFSSAAGTSTKFECINGIIYENLEDGTKKIVQALGSRGANQDGRVSVESDPDLANVSKIAEGGFADIPELASVNFEGNSILREVPDAAFFGDPLLSRVTLPDSLRMIGEYAFGNCGAGMDVYIYGREVSMATTAFDNTPNPTVYTYDDTAAYNTAVKVVGPNNVEKIPEGFRVQFFDYDGITALTDVQYVEQGDSAEPPEEDPKREGYIFRDWNKPYKDIQAHTDIIALYDIDPNGPYGGGAGGTNKPGEGNDGVQVPGGTDIDGDGKPDFDENGNKLYTLTVSNGTGGGRYPAGKKVAIQAGAAPDGAGFTHWSSTNKDVIFNDATDVSTTLTMPAADTTVVCNFAGYYRLDVVYGSGSGSYPAGAKIEISAVDAPQGRSFASWRSSTSGLTIENSRKQTTTVTMPKSHATVTATYMDNGSLSGNSTTKKDNSGTKVQITKPGIPNKDKASAYVSGSSDNFIVKISESAEATDAVQKALQAKYPDMTRVKYFAMDISLYDATGTRKITDTTGLKVNITIPIPEALNEYAGNNKMAAVVNGQIEDLPPKFVTIDGVPCISFTATHFSPYTVYVDTANLTVTNTLDSTPKTGDGIHPKWFVSIGLASISIILFLKRDRRYTTKLS